MKLLHAVDESFSLEKSPASKRPERGRPNPHLQRIEQILAGVFDHNATLIDNLSLQGGAIQAPLALVTLSGITLLYLDSRRGVFRARSGEWEQLDERRKRYRPSQPNPLEMALSQVAALRTYLAEQGYAGVGIQAVIIFTDPGIHIEAEESQVRLVYGDGFPRFAAQLARARPTLTINEVHSLVPILAPYTMEDALAAREIRDDFSLREEMPRQVQLPAVEIPLPADDKLVSAIQKVPFTQRQLLVIAVLVVLNIIILIALVLVILAFS